MSNEELIEENKQLKERIAFLENVINKGNAGNSSAYNAIRLMIIEKVNKEVEIPEHLENWQKKDIRQRAERQIMRDFKWDLHIRTNRDFKDEHVDKAKKYISNYVIPEHLKRSRWN